MDKTPEKIVGAMIERCQSKAEASLMAADIAAAVIAHVTPQIRAAAIEDVIALGTQQLAFGGVGEFYEEEKKRMRALAPLPPGHVCVPTRPERERINAGAERLLRWQEDTKPEDFSALQWAEARQDAERVYLSMVQYDAAAKEPK